MGKKKKQNTFGLMLIIRILVLNQNLKLNVFNISVIRVIFLVEHVLLFDGNISMITFEDLFNTFEKGLQISVCANEILQNLNSDQCYSVYGALHYIALSCLRHNVVTNVVFKKNQNISWLGWALPQVTYKIAIIP